MELSHDIVARDLFSLNLFKFLSRIYNLTPYMDPRYRTRVYQSLYRWFSYICRLHDGVFRMGHAFTDEIVFALRHIHTTLVRTQDVLPVLNLIRE